MYQKALGSAALYSITTSSSLINFFLFYTLILFIIHNGCSTDGILHITLYSKATAARVQFRRLPTPCLPIKCPGSIATTTVEKSFDHS